MSLGAYKGVQFNWYVYQWGFSLIIINKSYAKGKYQETQGKKEAELTIYSQIFCDSL